MKKTIFLILSVLVIAGCDQNSSGMGAGQSGKANVFSIAATSEKSGNPVENAFDGNSSTAWIPAGNPSEEGVTIRFLEGMKIEDLTIIPHTSSKASYSIYINGSLFGDMDAGTVLIDRDKVMTIYIKCKSSASTGLKEVIINKKAGEKLIYPQKVNATVKASSSLSPIQSYAPELVFDGRLDFGWVEGVKGQGIGEALRISFAKKIMIDTIYIANGYQRSDTHFEKNSRVKSLGVSSGTELESYSVKDKSGIQIIRLKKALSTQDLSLIIKDIYPGSKYQDTVISELKFGYKGELINLSTDIDAQIAREIKSKLSGSFFNKAVGKLLTQEKGDKNFTLKLRDNGSFVMWYSSENLDYDGQVETSDRKEGVKDGNWVIKSSGATVVVKIFGRDQQVRTKKETSYNPYSENVAKQKSSQNTTIFSDTLTISQKGNGLNISSEQLDGVFDIK